MALAGPGYVVPVPAANVPVAATANMAQVYGKMIPISSGKRAVNGDYIWASPPRAREVETYVEGSTPGGSSYYWRTTGAVVRDLAVSFGYPLAPAAEGGRVGLLRLWLNGTLVYDARDPQVILKHPELEITFHEGTEDQLADPVIAADKGDVTPAFRGMIYAVVKNYHHPGTVVQTSMIPGATMFDTSLPTVRAELVDGLTISSSNADFAAENDLNFNSAIVQDWETYELWSFSDPTTGAVKLHRYDQLGEAEVDFDTITGTVDGVAYTALQFGEQCSIDRLNDLVFTTANGISNTAPVVCVDLRTAEITADFGTGNANLTPQPTGGPFTSIPYASHHDVVHGTEQGLTRNAICTGGTSGYFCVVPYSADGLFDADTDIAEQVAGSSATTCVLGYPILDILRERDTEPALFQDCCVLYASGSELRALYFGWRDGRPKMIGNHLVKTFTGSTVRHVCVDPVDKGLVVFTRLATGSLAFSVHKFNAGLFDLSRGYAAAGIDVGEFRGVGPIFNYTVAVGSLGQTADGLLWSKELSAAQAVNIGNTFAHGFKMQSNRASPMGWVSGANFVQLNPADGGIVSASMGVSPNYWLWDHEESVVYRRNTSTDRLNAVGLSRAEGAAADIGDVARWIALLMGYETGDISVDAALTDTVRGVVIDHPYDMSALLNHLGQLYDFSHFESEGKIKFARAARSDTGGTAAFDITRQDMLPVAEGGAGDNEVLITTLNSPAAQPLSIAVKFIDVDLDYAWSTQTYNQDTHASGSQAAGQATLDVPVVLTANEAFSRVAKVQIRSGSQTVTQEFRLPQKRLRLEPGDVLSVTIAPYKYIVRLDEVTLNADWSVSCLGLNYAFNDTVPITSQDNLGTLPQVVPGKGDSAPLVLDTPLIDPTYDFKGSGKSVVWVGALSFGQRNWPGATVTWKPDAEEEFEPLFQTTVEPVTGTVVSALPSAADPFDTDEELTIEVALRTGDSSDFTTATETQLLEGKNLCAIGAQGRWEFVAFRTATVVSPKRVQLTGVVRGRNGTDDKHDTHLAGDQFILLKSVDADFALWWSPHTYGEALDGGVFDYRSAGEFTQHTYDYELTLASMSLRPWAPIPYLADRDGADDITVSWHRRDRLGGNVWLTEDTPLSEASESYEVDILDGPGGAVLRTLASASQSVVYTAANQTTDGLSLTATQLTVKVYQLSAEVGRGLTREFTLNVE